MIPKVQYEAFENLADVDLSKFIRTIASEQKLNIEYEEIKDLVHTSVIWVDSDIEKTSDGLDTKSYLHTFLGENLKTYTDPDEFLKYVSLLAKENIHERIFLIVSGSYGEYLFPQIKQCSSIVFIYIFCLNFLYHKEWTRQYINICGIFTNKHILVARINNDIRLYASNIPPFSILNLNDNEKSTLDLTKENAKFMWYQLLMDLLLRMTNNTNKNAKEDMLNECRAYYEKNQYQINLIDEFDKTYSSSDAVKWYTRDCFLFRLLNKAFRTENIDIIYKFRIFIIDLYEQLKQLHNEYVEYMGLDEIVTVYRGQQMSPNELNKLKDNIGCLISMNTFLSTSLNESTAKIFAGNGSDSPNRESVLFVITIDANKVKLPFGRIDHVSYMRHENEILFSMATVFRIESVSEIRNDQENIWCVRLTTFNQDDHDIDALLNFYKRYTDKSDPLIIWAKFLSDMGEYSKSEWYYKKAIESITPIDDLVLGTIYNNIGVTYVYRNQLDTAFEYYMLGLDAKQKNIVSLYDQTATSIDHNLSIASSYHNIAHVCYYMNDYQSALESYLFSLNIKRFILTPYNLTIATTLNCIAQLYSEIGEFSKASQYYNEALDIYNKTLPKKHPERAILYENLGYAFYNQKDYMKANDYYHKALEMNLDTLPSNSQQLAKTYKLLAKLYLDTDDYDNALENYLNAIDISKLYIDSFYLEISDMYNAVGTIYVYKSDLSKALKYYQLSLQMNMQYLSINHEENLPRYNNIAMVYSRQGKYFDAINLYHTSLDILLNTNTLIQNHTMLAYTYSNLANAYLENKQDSEALDYFQEALAIGKTIFHTEHPLIKSIHYSINGIRKRGDKTSTNELRFTAASCDSGHLPEEHRPFIYSIHARPAALN